MNKIALLTLAAAFGASLAPAAAATGNSHYYVCTAEGPYGAGYVYVSPVFSAPWGRSFNGAWASAIENYNQGTGRRSQTEVCQSLSTSNSADNVRREHMRHGQNMGGQIHMVPFYGR